MTFTTRELEQAMENVYGSYWSDLSWSIKQNGNGITVNGTEYRVEYVDDGPEHADYDSSSPLYVVFKVGDKTYMKSGYYQSHYGSEWDGPVQEVEPEEVTVTRWKAV